MERTSCPLVRAMQRKYNALSAWAYTKGSKKLTVCIVDSGIYVSWRSPLPALRPLPRPLTQPCVERPPSCRLTTPT